MAIDIVSIFVTVCNRISLNPRNLPFSGEEKLSYGYGGTGKASTDCKFTDYGKAFAAGDVVTSYVVS